MDIITKKSKNIIYYLGYLVAILLIAILFIKFTDLYNVDIDKLRKDLSRPGNTRQQFTNVSPSGDRNQAINNILENIKTQNPTMVLDENYVNYLFDKYFSGDQLLDKLTQKESSRIVSDLKSNFIIPYDVAEEQKLKEYRAREQLLESS